MARFGTVRRGEVWQGIHDVARLVAVWCCPVRYGMGIVLPRGLVRSAWRGRVRFGEGITARLGKTVFGAVRCGEVRISRRN